MNNQFSKLTKQFSKRLDEVKKELTESQKLQEAANVQSEIKVEKCCPSEQQLSASARAARTSLSPTQYAALKASKKSPTPFDVKKLLTRDPFAPSEPLPKSPPAFKPDPDYVYTAPKNLVKPVDQQGSALGQTCLLLGQSTQTLWNQNWSTTQNKSDYELKKKTYQDYDDTQNAFKISGSVDFVRQGMNLSTQLNKSIKAPIEMHMSDQTRSRAEHVVQPDMAYLLADQDRKKAKAAFLKQYQNEPPIGKWQPQRMMTTNQMMDHQTHLTHLENGRLMRDATVARAQRAATKMFGEGCEDWVQGLNQKELEELVGVDESMLRKGM
ncbi:Conserved_hypothetical protein [Hexamita inflata]|uniref:Uncharacterized protein n=1 Tax=Hexamita inflata TaxID=28002 RepID=A0AA86R9I3_9EUKA|nr:Conserved hypothetical protein [Hexamita inflata]